MHDANEMECLIFENAIKNILLGRVTQSGVSDANNKLIITIFQMWGHIDPIRSDPIHSPTGSCPRTGLTTLTKSLREMQIYTPDEKKTESWKIGKA